MQRKTKLAKLELSIFNKVSKQQLSKFHINNVHQKGGPNNCGLCDKSFSDAGYLKIHIHMIHEAHKDNKCESCGKSFPQANTLKKHIHTIHEGQKDYKCESWGK